MTRLYRIFIQPSETEALALHSDENKNEEKKEKTGTLCLFLYSDSSGAHAMYNLYALFSAKPIGFLWVGVTFSRNRIREPDRIWLLGSCYDSGKRGPLDRV